MKFETDTPTEADIRYDAYIRSIVINTNKNIADRLRMISREVSYDDLMENNQEEGSYEDKYDFEKRLPYIVFENGQEYRIDSPQLYYAIQALKPVDRKTILLSIVNCYKDKEIGKVLQIPRRTISSRRRRIIGKIRTNILVRGNTNDE